ncbi:MAG: cbb3-type cytochrome c oxidase subunit 3 [Pseudomonadota bacterium]
MENQSHIANSTYELMRDFADSWFLIVMVTFFVGVVLFTLRPGSRSLHDKIAGIPLRDDRPMTEEPAAERSAENV